MTVTPSQVATALGQTSPEPLIEQQWQLWIDSAYRLIDNGARRRKIAVSSLDPADVDYVVGEVVVAHVKRPDAATQVDVQVEDGRVSRRYEKGQGRVVLDDSWWDFLLPSTPSSSGAFSVRPRFVPDRPCW